MNLTDVARTPWRWALVAWTIAIWVSRARNALVDDDLDRSGVVAATAIASGFVVLAVVVALATARHSARARVALGALAVLGIARWTHRGIAILLSDEWGVGFQVVHTVLWAVTVVLSVLAWRELRSAGDRLDPGLGYDSGHGSARLRS